MENERKPSFIAIVGILVGVVAGGLFLARILTWSGAARSDVAVGGRAGGDDADSQPDTRPVAAEFALKDLAGKSVKLSDYRGKVVVVNFWASWCLPCRLEIPAFVKLHEKYQARGLEIIGVSVDEDGPDGVQSVVRTERINYPVVMATPDIIGSYGPINAIPTTFVLDRQGQVYQIHRGTVSYAEIESTIRGIL
jgi:peroxiredoxin